MEILMFVIFLFSDVITVGACMFAINDKDKYKDGMILGVHIPKDNLEDEYVKSIITWSISKSKVFNRINMIIGIAICFVNWIGIMSFMVVWIVWFCEYIGGFMYLMYRPHKKLYNLKLERGWIDEKTKHISYDHGREIITDDDEYWKNGWYNNPNDKHLFVTDRLQSSSYSMNMAKTSAKISTFLFIVITVGILGWVVYVMAALGNVNVTMTHEEDIYKIEGAMYSTEFDNSSIISVELLSELPDDHFTKSSGASTEDIKLGHFKGNETGKCLMFLNVGVNPVIKITTQTDIIFFNSKDAEQTRQWYDELSKM